MNNWSAAEKSGDVAKTGAASDFWLRYEEDFARCRELGMNAFRLGIEWSRVQPSTEIVSRRKLDPPPFDREALDHYVEMLSSCRAHGLEPIVTLQHFVHPSWLGFDAWLDPETPELFARFVREAIGYICERLERPLHWFITINEPNMLVVNSYFGRHFPARAAGGFGAMVAAYTQLLRAHILAYNALHDLYAERGWPAPQVSLNSYCSDVYWSDKMILDLLAARERGVPRHKVSDYIVDCARDFDVAFRKARLPLHRDLAYYFGAAAKRITMWIGYRRFGAADFGPLLETLYTSPRARVMDYIGLDYYDPFAAHVFRLPVFWDHEFRNKSLRSWVLSTVTSKWWDWRVLPRGLHFFCKHYAESFGRPVLIAENGMAVRRQPDNRSTNRRDRMSRSQFLRLHVHEVVKIVNEGVPLIGYLHWSLFDNYEWGSFTPRFGLYALDYTRGTERHEEDPWGDRPARAYAELIAESRAKMKLPARSASRESASEMAQVH